VIFEMRIIARSALISFWTRHPETETSLWRWFALAKAADWASTQDVVRSFPRAKTINGERVRFPGHGGAYRLIVDFERQTAFVKFIGTHAAYDEIDAATVSLF
jgi:mRNA interferase HigB